MTLHTRGPNESMNVLAKLFVGLIVICLSVVVIVATYGLVQLILGRCGG